MNQRIHEALDGEIDRSRLTASEQDEMQEAEADFDAVVRAIPTDVLPDLSPVVMARIRNTAAPRRQSLVIPVEDARPARRSPLVHWLWTSRPISFGWRPAYAVAAGLLIALLSIRAVRTGERSTTPAPVFTRFVLHLPNATRVSLAGDFTGWQASLSLTRSGPDLWTVIVPLTPGVHTYAFVVDGERWIADPMAPAVDDGFGGTNSRVAVLAPDTRKL